MAGVDVGGVELDFTCPQCGGQALAAIEAVRVLPVIDCPSCGARFGVDLEAFSARVTEAEAAARPARRGRNKA
jgi:transcription elongation factor Elf1